MFKKEEEYHAIEGVTGIDTKKMSKKERKILKEVIELRIKQMQKLKELI